MSLHGDKMKSYDRLLNLKRNLVVSKNSNGDITVYYEYSYIKVNGVLIGLYGKGKTFEEACDDYLNLISGKTLIFETLSGNREEIQVL